MTVKKMVFAYLLLLFWQPINAQSDNTYTLQQCVDIAFKNNNDVKQADLSAESARINYEQSKANRLPTLSAGISHSLYNGRSINPYTNSYIDEQNITGSYSLGTNVTLWNGSSLQNYMRQYALSYEAGKMDAQNVKDNLTINIILNYLSVLSNQEQLVIAEQQVEATKEKVNILTVKNNDGSIAPSDLYDMKGQLATDEINVVSTKNTLESAKLKLAQLMNIAYSPNMKFAAISDADVLPELYDATVDEIYNNATSRLALIKSGELKKASAIKNIQAIKGSMLPSLYFSGNLYTNYSNTANTMQYINSTDVQTDNYVMVNNVKTPVYQPQSNYNSVPISYGSQFKNNLYSGLSIGLQIPISNNLQYRNKLKQAKIAEQQATVQSENNKVQLRQAIEQDYLNLTAAYETYKKYLLQMNNFEQSFHAADVKFKAGATLNIVDFIIAKNNLDRAELNLVAAKYDYILKRKLLDFYQNKQLW